MPTAQPVDNGTSADSLGIKARIERLNLSNEQQQHQSAPNDDSIYDWRCKRRHPEPEYGQRAPSVETNGHGLGVAAESVSGDSGSGRGSLKSNISQQQQQQHYHQQRQVTHMLQVYSQTERVTPLNGAGDPHHPHHVYSPPSPPAPPHDHSAVLRTDGLSSGYAELDSTLQPPSRLDPVQHVDDQPCADYSSLHYSHRAHHMSSDQLPMDVGYRPASRLSTHTTAAAAAPRAVFDEVLRDVVHEQDVASGDVTSLQPLQFRDPDLHEVINFLGNANNVVKANAAAYLQHLCYMDDAMKQKTRALGGIPPLVALLAHDIPEVHRNACGALRNLSYGRQNDENKRAICQARGVPALVRLLRKTPENEIKELVTGILWNLSSCEQLKRPIIDDGLAVLVNYVVIPHSGWNRCGSGPPATSGAVKDVFWSTVFRNGTGVLRNVSSAGEYARRCLRECDGLVDALLLVIRSAIGKDNIDNKCVENCVCVLRNLSYRCQEVEDPDYDKHQSAVTVSQQNRAPNLAVAGSNTDGAGCFGGRRQRDPLDIGGSSAPGTDTSLAATQQVHGMHLLWQPDIVQPYLKLLSDCSNPETLEAAAGAIQNLAACYWQPSVDVRATVRKEKGLPILVELLRMEADRVVCAVATALRNLAIDQRNKELIGKYAMRDLIQKLPAPAAPSVPGSMQVCDGGGQVSDDTIAAVLATLNEVIRRSAEFCRSLFELDGVRRLLAVTRQRGRYSARVVKFAAQLLFSMWSHHELRDAYRKAGYREADFVARSVAVTRAGGSAAGSVNSTLNRPMASQGSTRYEDRTVPRSVPACGESPYGHIPAATGEPLYAQVNRERKRQQQQQQHPQQQQPPQHQESSRVWGLRDNTVVGDSWV